MIHIKYGTSVMYRDVSSAEVMNGALVIHVKYGTTLMYRGVSSAGVLNGT